MLMMELALGDPDRGSRRERGVPAETGQKKRR
jgi:hypothetical protein